MIRRLIIGHISLSLCSSRRRIRHARLVIVPSVTSHTRDHLSTITSAAVDVICSLKNEFAFGKKDCSMGGEDKNMDAVLTNKLLNYSSLDSSVT